MSVHDFVLDHVEVKGIASLIDDYLKKHPCYAEIKNYYYANYITFLRGVVGNVPMELEVLWAGRTRCMYYLKGSQMQYLYQEDYPEPL